MRVIAGLAALLTALCMATGALAHAALVSADPADGSILTQSPKTLQLRFNEIVAPAVVGLIDAAGKTRDVTSRAAGQMVVIALPDDLPQGTQVVSYRVVSQDGHPVAGSLMFSIGVVTGAARAGEFESGCCRPDLAVSDRGLSRPVRRRRRRVLRVLDRMGPERRAGDHRRVAHRSRQRGGVARPARPRPAEPAAQRPVFIRAMEECARYQRRAVVADCDRCDVDGAPGLAKPVDVDVLEADRGRHGRRRACRLSTSSHAATAAPEWVTGPAVFVHGVAIAFWVGALAPLIALARKRNGTVLPVLLRFSRIAVPVVGALVLTGVGLAIVQLESFGALIGTRYGVILLVKLTLVAILLGLAALNRYRVTPALKVEPGNSRELKGTVFYEYVAVLLILAVVAGWRFTAPPRALAAAAQAAVEAPLAIHIHTETAMFQVLISPGKVGSDDFVLQLMAGDASPLPAKEATLTLSLPERGIEPIERAATLGPDGYWHLRGVPLPLPGRWHMRIDALVTDFEKVTLEDDFEVR